MNAHAPAVHLDESDLLHVIDGDAAPGELARWGEHLELCPTCSGRLAVLRADATRLRVELETVQLPPDFPSVQLTMQRARAARAREVARTPARRDQRWLRVAAVILALLLPLAAISPVRAAIVEWVRQGWSTLVGDAPAEPPTTGSTGVGLDPSGYTLWFTPTAPLLEITIVSSQPRGELVIAPIEGTEGSLEVRGEDGTTAHVDDAGLTVRNHSGSAASYVVGVPAAVERVRVRIGAAPGVVVERAALTPAWRRSLAQ